MKYGSPFARAAAASCAALASLILIGRLSSHRFKFRTSQHGKAALLRFPQQQAEGHEPDQDSSKPSLYLHSDITVPNDTHRHEIPLQVAPHTQHMLNDPRTAASLPSAPRVAATVEARAIDAVVEERRPPVSASNP